MGVLFCGDEALLQIKSSIEIRSRSVRRYPASACPPHESPHNTHCEDDRHPDTPHRAESPRVEAPAQDAQQAKDQPNEQAGFQQESAPIPSRDLL